MTASHSAAERQVHYVDSIPNGTVLASHGHVYVVVGNSSELFPGPNPSPSDMAIQLGSEIFESMRPFHYFRATEADPPFTIKTRADADFDPAIARAQMAQLSNTARALRGASRAPAGLE